MRKHRLRICSIWIALVLSGCAVSAGEFTVDTGCFRVVFADPADPELGYRFLRFGWIKELVLNGREENLFHTESLFDFHPAFGCAQEILPDLPLASGDMLKIGVGIFQPHPGNYFRSRATESFPWRTAREQGEHGTVFTARQFGGREGYAYELTVKITMQEHSPVILFEQALANTGERPISGSVYMHPFFNARNGLDEWSYTMPGRAPQFIASQPENLSLEHDQAEGRTSIVAETREAGLIISADTPFCKSVFWSNGSNCFAVEPFIQLDIQPGAAQSWRWRLTVIRHRQETVEQQRKALSSCKGPLEHNCR